MDKKGNRILAARLARQLYNKEITFTDLEANYPEDTEDNEIQELFDLIEHEPKAGGLFGVSQSTHQNHMNKIQDLIIRLER
jgi:hypothetical protein